MKLTLDGLENRAAWEKAGIRLPDFNVEISRQWTRDNPQIIFFGGGNIYVTLPAAQRQDLIEKGSGMVGGLIVFETFDPQIITDIYQPHDNLRISAILHADGKIDYRVIATTADALIANPNLAGHRWPDAIRYFTVDSLQEVNFATTEKSYSLFDPETGNLLPDIKEDIENGPTYPKTLLGIVSALEIERMKKGCGPIAYASLDNCFDNSTQVYNGIAHFISAWIENGFVDNDALLHLEQNSFPCCEIDQVVANPKQEVLEDLTRRGVEDLSRIQTKKNTLVAPFANGEPFQLIVQTDAFPSGRPKYEYVGRMFCGDNAMTKRYVEIKMGSVVNPTHTIEVMAGLLLGYESIDKANADLLIRHLVEYTFYNEKLPVIPAVGHISAEQYFRTFVDERLPNEPMSDLCRRPQKDSSTKVGPRLIETVKLYGDKADSLKGHQLAYALWLRCYMGEDDHWKKIDLDSDPNMEMIQGHLSKIKIGNPSTVTDDVLRPILSSREINAGINLYDNGFAQGVIEYMKDLVDGTGAVRRTLEEFKQTHNIKRG